MPIDREREVLVAVGRAIAAARRAHGLSQTTLAEEIGVSRFTVLNVERGHCSVGAGTVLLMLRRLGLMTAGGAIALDAKGEKARRPR